MFFEKPKGKSLEELYDWCCEITEKLNRSEAITEKEKSDGGDIHD